VNRLAERDEAAKWIHWCMQARDEEQFSDAAQVAKFLLIREFSRWPDVEAVKT
jgi:hypothetical protein